MGGSVALGVTKVSTHDVVCLSPATASNPASIVLSRDPSAVCHALPSTTTSLFSPSTLNLGQLRSLVRITEQERTTWAMQVSLPGHLQPHLLEVTQQLMEGQIQNPDGLAWAPSRLLDNYEEVNAILRELETRGSLDTRQMMRVMSRCCFRQ